MSSRDKILAAIATNQPGFSDLPDISFLKGGGTDTTEKFIETLTTIGGIVIKIKDYQQIEEYIKSAIATGQRAISNITELSESAELINGMSILPHSLQDIELAIIKAYIGVAENGAVWVKEELLNQRVLPFICQHLAVVLDANEIVPTMHEAYEKIGNTQYGFATFIAGPSKTADIEQSLVLGAHGPRTMTVFLLN